MILADRDIVEFMRRKEFSVAPLAEDAIQPASVDLRLGTTFKVFPGCLNLDGGTPAYMQPTFRHIDPEEPQVMDTFDWSQYDFPFILYPQMFALARTEEMISLGPRISSRLEGKSSLGRLGLFIHSTAGFFDPGFTGTATLELFNGAPHPLVLRPGMKIAQMSFTPTFNTVAKPYGHPDLGSKYQGQIDPEESRFSARR